MDGCGDCTGTATTLLATIEAPDLLRRYLSREASTYQAMHRFVHTAYTAERKKHCTTSLPCGTLQDACMLMDATPLHVDSSQHALREQTHTHRSILDIIKHTRKRHDSHDKDSKAQLSQANMQHRTCMQQRRFFSKMRIRVTGQSGTRTLRAVHASIDSCCEKPEPQQAPESLAREHMCILHE